MIESSVLSSDKFAFLIIGEGKVLKARMLVSYFVCPEPTRDCVKRLCRLCEGKSEELSEILMDTFEENEIYSIEYETWESTDRTQIIDHDEPVEVFVFWLMKRLLKLAEHIWEFEAQNKFIKELREKPALNECVISSDFAENFEFFESDSVQSAYYSKGHCTIFPMMLKLNINGEIITRSTAAISDSLAHSNLDVYAFLYTLNQYLREEYPEITFQTYCSDGSGSQFKGRNSFINVSNHQNDFGLLSRWIFAATGHFKLSIRMHKLHYNVFNPIMSGWHQNTSCQDRVKQDKKSLKLQKHSSWFS